MSKPIFSRKGMTLTEASKLTGIPVRTLARWTSDSREDYLARANEKRERVRELRAQGLTMPDERLGALGYGTLKPYLSFLNKEAGDESLSVQQAFEMRTSRTGKKIKESPHTLHSMQGNISH